jgi:hypothetical protein
MKTTSRFSKTLAKAVCLAVLVSISAGNVSSQKSLKANLPYKTDFIKQMLYQLSYDYLVNKGATVTLSEYSVKNPVARNEQWMEKNGRTKVGKASSGSSSEFYSNTSALENFLVKASHLKDGVIIIEEVPVEVDNSIDELEQFLTEAAQPKHVESRDEEMSMVNDLSSYVELEQFLTSASHLKDRIEMEEAMPVNASESDQLEEFLVRASHLKDRVNENKSAMGSALMASAR